MHLPCGCACSALSSHDRCDQWRDTSKTFQLHGVGEKEGRGTLCVKLEKNWFMKMKNLEWVRKERLEYFTVLA